MASILTIALYVATWLMLLHTLLSKKASIQTRGTLLWVAAGVAAHAMTIYAEVIRPSDFSLSFFNALSLVFFVINLLVTLSSLRQPLHNLFVFLLPLSALALAANALTTSPASDPVPLSAGMIAHILLSILAYSLLTIATLQALLLAYQNRQLRAKHFQVVRGIMPPLQTMEALLFEMLWTGFLLLSLSIITGALFIENIFAQHLAHKAVFSVLSWLIYAVLLGGHQLRGWRGAAALRWVLGGFAALLLAYFGSKFVLEIVLAKP